MVATFIIGLAYIFEEVAPHSRTAASANCEQNQHTTTRRAADFYRA